MGDNKIYVDANDFIRLCRLDGRMDSLIAYIQLTDEDQLNMFDKDIVKAIIGMDDE